MLREIDFQKDNIMNVNQSMMDNHFSKVAPQYKELRTTDIEPIIFIGETLKGLSAIKVADVGCGDGRYDLLLFQHFNNLQLTCIDTNAPMLEATSKYLTAHDITQFTTAQVEAEILPLDNNSMDCVLTFNAIHHFDVLNFLNQSARILKERGRIFIYTRYRSQNARNIWGQYFPAFVEKETRLYEQPEMEQWIQSVDSLVLETVKSFKYPRQSTLERLVRQAKGKHYSTFSLYQESELKGALKTFQDNLKKAFQNTNQIKWFDENVLLVLTKNYRGSCTITTHDNA